MTARSPRGGRRIFDSTRFDNQSPVGTMVVRDALLNNILHAADEANAKVLVNWTAPKSSLIAGTPQTYVTGDLEAADTWYPIESYGPFGLSVFADGTPYPLVVEVLARSSTAGADVSVAVQVSRTPHELSTFREYQRWNTSSATPAWLTSVSASNLIVPARSALLPPVPRPTIDAASSSLTREVLQCDVYVNVFGWSDLGVDEVQLHGMHVREYVGS